jgi:hypothetical protein
MEGHEDPRRTDGTTRTDGQDHGGAPHQIDATIEELLSLSEAAKRVPKLNGRRVHASTIFRWCRRGLSGVRLEYVRIGRRMATSAEALNRFFNALAAADGEAPAHRHVRTAERRPSQAARTRAISQAEAKLDADGL